MPDPFYQPLTMQPSLILPIILKDLRANRWLFAAFFAATILITASCFLSPQDFGPLARSGMVLVYCLYIPLTLLTMARVVHADPPASDTAFLATRPVSVNWGQGSFSFKFWLSALRETGVCRENDGARRGGDRSKTPSADLECELQKGCPR
jgi:hypothetical protein